MVTGIHEIYLFFLHHTSITILPGWYAHWMSWHLALSFLKSHRELKVWDSSFVFSHGSASSLQTCKFHTGLNSICMQWDHYKLIFQISSLLLLRHRNDERLSWVSSAKTSPVHWTVKCERYNSALPLLWKLIRNKHHRVLSVDSTNVYIVTNLSFNEHCSTSPQVQQKCFLSPRRASQPQQLNQICGWMGPLLCVTVYLGGLWPFHFTS